MTGAVARFPAWPDQGADAMERELLARWKSEGLFQRVQETRKDGPPFVFYEGPPLPTASDPHVSPAPHGPLPPVRSCRAIR